MDFQLDTSRCIQCGACIRDCTVHVLEPDASGSPAVPSGNEAYCIGCQHCMAICPKGAITIDGATPEHAMDQDHMPSEPDMLHLIRRRRSIRQYRSENLDQETLGKLKRSLNWTPTGCNDHRLFFVVVESREVMDVFREKTSGMLKFLLKSGIMKLLYPKAHRFASAIQNGEDVIYRNAPHMIIAATPKNAPCAGIDPVIALTQFDLYAQTLGVGCCWCGFAMHVFKWNRSIRKMLKLPPGYVPGYVLLFGRSAVKYPRGTDPKPFSINSL